ncbi:50S ribosomal protein L35 [Grifola frondosa]|uniref:50S ribosomal protein L35 n=1 Tax=Grifola frondosa TaxID=5627 RepID=A0A1C7M3U8_GRIFR|nr:50S ribosomal protein L35 [Grifola frondosa]
MLFARLLATTRLFSTSAVSQLYKLKTHQGTKKRWRSIASGVFKRGKAGHKHLNVSKSPSRKNRLGQTAYSHGSQTPRLKKLLPYVSVPYPKNVN